MRARTLEHELPQMHRVRARQDRLSVTQETLLHASPELSRAWMSTKSLTQHLVPFVRVCPCVARDCEISQDAGRTKTSEDRPNRSHAGGRDESEGAEAGSRRTTPQDRNWADLAGWNLEPDKRGCSWRNSRGCRTTSRAPHALGLDASAAARTQSAMTICALRAVNFEQTILPRNGAGNRCSPSLSARRNSSLACASRCRRTARRWRRGWERCRLPVRTRSPHWRPCGHCYDMNPVPSRSF